MNSSLNSRLYSRISRILDAHIHPQFRLKIFLIYGFLFFLMVLRIYIGVPFLALIYRFLYKTLGRNSVTRINKNSVKYLRALLQFFISLFPLLFPFIVAMIVQTLRSNRRNR